MAVFDRLPQHVIKSEFTHYAKLHGVPIYFNIDSNAVCVRNWYPEWLLDLGELFFTFTCDLFNLRDQMYAIKLESEITPTEDKPDGQ